MQALDAFLQYANPLFPFFKKKGSRIHVGASLKRAQAEGRILPLSFNLLFTGPRPSSRCTDPRGKPAAAKWRCHPESARALCERCEGPAFRFSLGVGCPILAGLVFARVGLFRDGSLPLHALPPKAVIPNPLAPFASGVRDLLFA